MRLPQASAHDAKFASCSEWLMVGAVRLKWTGHELRRLSYFLRFVDMHFALTYLVL